MPRSIADGSVTDQGGASTPRRHRSGARTGGSTSLPGRDRAVPSRQSLDDGKAVYEVHAFGAIRVTQALLPLLQAVPRANIVMVSSGLGSLGWLTTPGHEFYGVNILR